MTTTDIESIAHVLLSHGEAFHGGCPEDVAADWDRYGFGCDEVDEWCDAEVWDASTASELRLAGMKPMDTQKVCLRMFCENGAGAYTGGWPTYAVCVGDMSPKKIIEAWKKMQ